MNRKEKLHILWWLTVQEKKTQGVTKRTQRAQFIQFYCLCDDKIFFCFTYSFLSRTRKCVKPKMKHLHRLWEVWLYWCITHLGCYNWVQTCIRKHSFQHTQKYNKFPQSSKVVPVSLIIGQSVYRSFGYRQFCTAVLSLICKFSVVLFSKLWTRMELFTSSAASD